MERMLNEEMLKVLRLLSSTKPKSTAELAEELDLSIRDTEEILKKIRSTGMPIKRIVRIMGGTCLIDWWYISGDRGTV